MTLEPDYYAILRITPDADTAAVRRAFRARAKACHPDRVAGLDADLRRLAEQKMLQLNAAYAVLGNSLRRAGYDRHHRAHGLRARARLAGEPTAPPSIASPEPPSAGPDGSYNRPTEGSFVVRAAAEELQGKLRALIGDAQWSVIGAPGMTVALRARRPFRDDCFLLLATTVLDARALRSLLRRLRSWPVRTTRGWWSRERVYGFAGGIELERPRRLERMLEQFNHRHPRPAGVGEATVVDLDSWSVVPGGPDLVQRLRSLI